MNKKYEIQELIKLKIKYFDVKQTGKHNCRIYCVLGCVSMADSQQPSAIASFQSVVWVTRAFQGVHGWFATALYSYGWFPKCGLGTYGDP